MTLKTFNTLYRAMLLISTGLILAAMVIYACGCGTDPDQDPEQLHCHDYGREIFALQVRNQILQDELNQCSADLQQCYDTP